MISRRFAVIAFSLIIMIVSAVFFFGPTKSVFAASPVTSPTVGQMGPTYKSALYLPTNTAVTPYYTVGSGGYNSPVEIIRVYVPSSLNGPFTVTVDNAGAGCITASGGGVVGPDFGNATTDFYLEKGLTNIVGPAILGPLSGGSGCNPVPPVSFTVKGGAIQGECFPSDQSSCGYRSFTLIGLLTNTVPGDKENAFRVSTTSGFVGIDGTNTTWGGYGYRDGDLTNGNKWDGAVVFSTDPGQCSSSTVLGGFHWEDADPTITDWSTNMMFRLWQEPRSASPTNSAAWQEIYRRTQGVDLSNNGGVDYNFNVNWRYMFTVENVGVRNTITIQLNGHISQLGARRTGPDLNCQPKCPDGSPLPPSGVCTGPTGKNFGGTCNISVAPSFTQNSPGSYSVLVTNTGTAEWRDATKTPNISDVYLSSDLSPPPGFTIFAEPNTVIIPTILPPGGSTVMATPIPIDTSTPGLHTIAFNLYRVRSAPLYWELLGSCSNTYNVAAPPPPPNNIIISNPNYSCTNVGANVHWQNPDPAPINVSITINGNPVGNPVDPFAAIPSLPINLNSYSVTINASGTDSYGQPHSANTSGSFGQSPPHCFTASCVHTSGLDFEPGETRSITDLGGYNVTNNTSRRGGFSIKTTVTGLSVSYPNPYPISGASYNYRVPASQATATTAAITITRELDYAINNNNSMLSPPGACTDTGINASRPYLKVFGGDVSAGGWFNKGNQSCATGPVQQVGSGGIRTFASANVPSHPYRAGASSEFAAFALGAIYFNDASKYGFYTWSLGNVARPPNTITTMNPLDFANTPPTDGLLGFSSGGTNTATEGCIKDYYSNASVSGGIVRPGNGNLNGKPASGGTTSSIYITNGSLSINGTWNFNPGERLTIYVPGDVYINTDIKYTGSGTDPAVGSVINPSYFSLIVQGNIYIASNVHVLEGLYIAQPNPADPATFSKKGNIWTCAVPSGGGASPAPSLAEISASCGGPNNKLTINGAVIAKHVTFNRIGDTSNTLSSVKLTDPETSTVISGGTNKSVEEINYIPEMVIGSPYFSVTGSNSRFDVVTILPPLF